jgi:hypothetical protein
MGCFHLAAVQYLLTADQLTVRRNGADRQWGENPSM